MSFGDTMNPWRVHSHSLNAHFLSSSQGHSEGQGHMLSLLEFINVQSRQSINKSKVYGV